MNGKTNYVLVGLFVLLLTTAFIAGILWLGAGAPGRSYDEYLVYMQESVSGLSRDSTVRYHGVEVGQVREITLGPSQERRVRLLLRINQGTPIRADTVATLETQGLTGLSYINLVGGSAAAPPLRPTEDGQLPIIRSQPSIWGHLDRSLGELADNLIDASARLEVLLSDDNQRFITRTLGHLEALSGALAGRADALVATLDDLAAAARQTRATSTQLPDLVGRLRAAAVALEGMAAEVGTAGTVVREAVTARGRDVARFSSEVLPEAVLLVGELRQAAENFRRFSEQLEQDPSRLLYGAPAAAPGPGE